jgi:hypothetical protein
VHKTVNNAAKVAVNQAEEKLILVKEKKPETCLL